MTLRGPEPGWHLVYDLSREHDLIAQIQKVTLETAVLGIKPDPHLFGSEPWWKAVALGEKPLTWIEGHVSSVRWGSMADWPEFCLVDRDGGETSWTRKGDPRRYVSGLGVRLGYVMVEQRHPSSEGPSKHTVELWVEDVPARSSGIAPGPGGIGYEEMGGNGALAHYAVFRAQRDADAAIGAVAGAVGRTWPERVSGHWWAQVIEPSGGWSDREHRRDVVAQIARAHGGTYDGSEIVGEPDSVRGPE